MNKSPLSEFANLAKLKIIPSLDTKFRPAALVNRSFRKLVADTGRGVPLKIGLARSGDTFSVYETQVLPADHPQAELNLPYIERIVKLLLWQKGGWQVVIGGPRNIGEYIQSVYQDKGARAFDTAFMGETLHERPFEVVITDIDAVTVAKETSTPVGRHLDGCRIGFDLGASDRKVAAVIDGNAVFSEEVVWDPRNQTDPQYHYDQIMAALRQAAQHLPRVDAIGGSSAGVVINNRIMAASLFRGVSKDLCHKRVKNIFLDMQQEWNVPFEVANDGEVTALAGAMKLNDTCVLGIAMGSSEAAGYVNAEGNLTGWIDELAFAPIDYHPDAPIDEWSGDIGCGVQYLTQQAVFRLATSVGIELDTKQDLAGRLKFVQSLLESGDGRAQQIWETIGCYIGYAIAHYADFYDIRHILILGRVTSGSGGLIIQKKAKEVLAIEFPELANTLQLHLPEEEAERRVGQVIAAASLPKIM